MVSSTVAPTAAAASAVAVAAIASSVGSTAAAALCLLAEWRLCASCVGRGAMAVLLHSHLLAHTLYSERRRRRRRRRQCHTVLQQ